MVFTGGSFSTRSLNFIHDLRESKGPRIHETIPILQTDAPSGTSVNNVVLYQSPVHVDGYEVAVAAVLFETGDLFVQKFGFEDDDADLVADPFTHLRGFGSEGDPNEIADGNEVFR